MNRSRTAALLWLLGGMAFVAAGLMASNRQVSYFAVAVLFFAVSVLTSRRARSLNRPR